jgi:Transposase zinc-ribbon domain
MKLSQSHAVRHPPRRLVVSQLGDAAVAYNLVQFQQGMSLPDFLKCFATEAACCEALRLARWPSGFACPKCSAKAHCVLGGGC